MFFFLFVNTVDTAVGSVGSSDVALSDFADDGMLANINAGTNGALTVNEERNGERQVIAYHRN